MSLTPDQEVELATEILLFPKRTVHSMIVKMGYSAEDAEKIMINLILEDRLKVFDRDTKNRVMNAQAALN